MILSYNELYLIVVGNDMIYQVILKNSDKYCTKVINTVLSTIYGNI